MPRFTVMLMATSSFRQNLRSILKMPLAIKKSSVVEKMSRAKYIPLDL